MHDSETFVKERSLQTDLPVANSPHCRLPYHKTLRSNRLSITFWGLRGFHMTGAERLDPGHAHEGLRACSSFVLDSCCGREGGLPGAFPCCVSIMH